MHGVVALGWGPMHTSRGAVVARSLLLVDLLTCLHLRVLQLFHVEGLSLGQ